MCITIAKSCVCFVIVLTLDDVCNKFVSRSSYNHPGKYTDYLYGPCKYPDIGIRYPCKYPDVILSTCSRVQGPGSSVSDTLVVLCLVLWPE